MSLPLADPQFWIVTTAAGIALALVLRRLPGVITVEPNVAEQARHLRVL